MVGKSCVHLLFAVVIGAALLMGCTAKPDEDLLKLSIEREFKRNLGHAVQVKNLHCSWIMATETRGETQARVAFVFPQGLYAKATAENFVQSDVSRNSLATLEKAINQAGTLGTKALQLVIPGLALESQGFVREILGNDAVIEGTLEVTATKGADGWTYQLSQPQFALPKELDKAITIHDGDIVLGSDEAKAYAKNFEQEIDDFVALVHETVQAANKEIHAQFEEDKKSILDVVKKDAYLTIVAEKSALREPVGFLLVDQVNSGTGLVSCSLVTVENPLGKQDITTSLILSPDHPAMFTVAISSPEPVEFPDESGFTASLAGKTLQFRPVQSQLVASLDDGRYILVAQDKNAFEQEMEKARAKTRERQAQQDAARQKQEQFLATIGALLSPGSGFEGTWNTSQANGIIGLAIETVTVDGSGCTGYLFDPIKRDKRKAFTGVINKAYPTSTLSITTTKSQGVKANYDSPHLDQLWLDISSTSTIAFTVEPEQLAGKLVTEGYSRKQGVFTLAPIANFSGILAGDAAREKERQSLLTQAVQDGSAWTGTYRCSDDVGEFGLYFTTRKDTFIAAELFDMSNPALRKKLTGILSLGKDAKYAIELNTVNGSGLEYENHHTNFQSSWLRKNQSYSLHLALVDGMLKGNTGYRCELSLAPMPDYAGWLARWQEQADRKATHVKVAIQPGNVYKGTWQESSGSGELGIRMTEVSQTGINFKAELYDPAFPQSIWFYTGSVVKDKKNKRMLKLVPSSLSQKGTYPPQTTRWRFGYYNNAHSPLNLYVAENGLKGEWRGAKVKLVKSGETLSSLIEKAVSARTVVSKQAGAFKTSEMSNSVMPAKDAATQPEKNGPETAEGPKQTPVTTPTAPDVQKHGAGPSSLIPANQKSTSATQKSAPATQKDESVTSPVTSSDAAVVLPKFAPLGGDGTKDRIMAHLVHQKGKDVVLALQLNAPGKTLSAVRIDNVGGLSSLWHSNDVKAAPLMVTSTSNARLDTFKPMGEEEVVLLRLQDNGAFSTQKTPLRFTAFFTDGTRAMCLLKE